MKAELFNNSTVAEIGEALCIDLVVSEMAIIPENSLFSQFGTYLTILLPSKFQFFTTQNVFPYKLLMHLKSGNDATIPIKDNPSL